MKEKNSVQKSYDFDRFSPEAWPDFSYSVRENLDVFSQEKNLHPAIFDALDLVNDADQVLTSPRNHTPENISRLNDFFRENPAGAELVSGILADRETISRFQNDGAYRTRKYSAETRDFLLGAPIYGVPEHVWAENPQYIRPSVLNRDLISKINLESVIIDGVINLEKLYRARKNKDSSADILQVAHESETIEIPMLKLMGFQHLAAILQSASGRLRMEFRGDGKYLNEAKDDFVKHGNSFTQLHEIFHVLASTSNENDFEGKLDIPYNKKYHALMGSGELTVGAGKNKVRARAKFRRKSLYSYAEKVQRFREKGVEDGKPADFLGEAIIVPDDANEAEIFAEITTNLRKDENFMNLHEKTAPERDAAIQIWGDEDYFAKISASLMKNGISENDFQHVLRENGLNLAKITLTSGKTNAPHELQFMTETVNERITIGELAHGNYKSGLETLDEDVVAQRKINHRREYMQDPDLLEKTRERSRRFRETIGKIAAKMATKLDS